MSKYSSLEVHTIKEAPIVSKFVIDYSFKVELPKSVCYCDDKFVIRSAALALAFINKIETAEKWSNADIIDTNVRARMDEYYHSGVYSAPHTWSIYFVDQFGRKCEVELKSDS